MAKEAAKEALEKYAQEGENFLLKNFRNKVLSNMFKKIMYALLKDCSFKGLQAIRCATEGGSQINTGVITAKKAELEKNRAINRSATVSGFHNGTNGRPKKDGTKTLTGAL